MKDLDKLNKDALKELDGYWDRWIDGVMMGKSKSITQINNIRAFKGSVYFLIETQIQKAYEAGREKLLDKVKD